MFKDQVNKVLQTAIRKRASDIYFLPREDHYSIKMNVVGTVETISCIPSSYGLQIINYLKFKADMALSEHRRPQIGAFLLKDSQTKKVFGRFSSLGDFLGRESLVVRLIYQEKDANEKFFFPSQLKKLENLSQKKGLILFSGPVGSGKTSTMYHLVRSLTDVQVMCIEDPVEIYEPNFLQIQVNEKANMSYAELVKASLRHRPDVFIIGEIRDAETAQIVVTAALSGHLVLSTVHAQSTLGVVRRLLDFGVSKADLEQTLQLIMYQRLIPTTVGNVKALFEQLSVEKLPWEKLENGGMTGMSVGWRESLEKCVQKNWISEETYKKYSEG
ncbi:competence protein ComGA [Liquorilactobacillus aquaticus DSM 21051]|uniref:Competence protein ComGA n=1 Tax=Liquorilactobacillus aquaticus DSM 21051 TaxID=1423725 RepID=A0A0R2CVP7_9LACO|nr:competence type IV pilus ATPase ComGA [Liquorilactobacillus aquaticus]KRM95584.1 competence protein ComGA [Liquorilactobacillus aquaticus DSM 21051]